jgi:hypothetical protein
VVRGLGHGPIALAQVDEAHSLGPSHAYTSTSSNRNSRRMTNRSSKVGWKG